MAQQIPEYDGPSVKDMIANHSIAENVIKHHHDAGNEIFDGSELALVRRFVNSPADRDQILADCNMVNDKDEVESGSGARQRSGSLAGYIVARHGSDVAAGSGSILTTEEITKLRDWFASGAADQAIGGRLETGRT